LRVSQQEQPEQQERQQRLSGLRVHIFQAWKWMCVQAKSAGRLVTRDGAGFPVAASESVSHGFAHGKWPGLFLAEPGSWLAGIRPGK
jgi:hypothetical protein